MEDDDDDYVERPGIAATILMFACAAGFGCLIAAFIWFNVTGSLFHDLPNTSLSGMIDVKFTQVFTLFIYVSSAVLGIGLAGVGGNAFAALVTGRDGPRFARPLILASYPVGWLSAAAFYWFEIRNWGDALDFLI